MEEKMSRVEARKALEKIITAGFSIDYDDYRSKGEILVGKDMVDARYPDGRRRERFYIAPKDWRFKFRWVHKGDSLKYRLNKKCRGEVVELGFENGAVTVKSNETRGSYLVFELHENRKTLPTKEAIHTKNGRFRYQGFLGSSCVFKYYTFPQWEVRRMYMKREERKSSLEQ